MGEREKGSRGRDFEKYTILFAYHKTTCLIILLATNFVTGYNIKEVYIPILYFISTNMGLDNLIYLFVLYNCVEDNNQMILKV